jgi:hypothetical protein
MTAPRNASMPESGHPGHARRLRDERLSRLSETFIAHEIHQLERLGLPLRLFAVKQEPEPMVHAVVAAIRAPLQHLPAVSSLSGCSLPLWLWRNATGLLARSRGAAAQPPWRLAAYRCQRAAAGLAAPQPRRLGAASLRKVFIKEFLQAGHIAAQVRSRQTWAICMGTSAMAWPPSPGWPAV